MSDESAFPIVYGVTGIVDAYGLTKRELFAAMALEGLIAGCLSGNNVGFTVQGNCVAAVEYADALLAELAKPGAGES